MKNKVLIVSAAAVLLVLGFFLGRGQYKSSESARVSDVLTTSGSTLVRDYSPVLGEPNAKVTLVEFLDPECESCRLVYPHVKSLLKEFHGKLRLVVRYAPFHGNSRFAIKILEGARRQDKYWQALDVLFNYQPQWGSHHDPNPERIWGYLPDEGIDVERVRKEFTDPAIEKMIEQEIADGQELGVRQTPTFFVNGKKLEELNLEGLRAAIEKEL